MTGVTVTPALIASAVSGIAGLVGALVPSTAPLTKGIVASSGMIGMLVFAAIHAVEVQARATRSAASINAESVTPIMHVVQAPPAPELAAGVGGEAAGLTPEQVDAQIDARLAGARVAITPVVPPA
jgi:hypothetical protein